MLAAMLSGYANNKNEAPASPPTHVIDYIKYMRQWYGDKDNIVYMRAINPDDNSLRSSVEVIPFQCPKDKGIMTKFKRAFFEDIDLAYHFTQAMPGQLGGWVVGIGDYKDQEMYTRDRTEQEHIAMWVKNAKNPEMRDYYGVVWDYKSDVIKGKIFIIYSRREDLQKDRNNSNSQEQNDNFFNSQKEKINETLLKINPEENVEEWWKDWNEKNGIKNKSLSSVPSIPSVPKGNAKVEKGVLRLNGHDEWVEVYRANNVELSSKALTVSFDVKPGKLCGMYEGAPYVTKGNTQFGVPMLCARQEGKEAGSRGPRPRNGGDYRPSRAWGKGHPYVGEGQHSG